MRADLLHHPCCLAGPQHFRAGDKIGSGPHVRGLGTSHLPSGGPQRFTTGDKMRSGPNVGGLATSPLPFGGYLTLLSGGQNQKWPTIRRIGYITLAV